MRCWRALLCGLCFCVGFSHSAASAAGWSLWPFGGKDEPVRSSSPGTRQMTGMTNNWGGQAAAEEPSMLTRMNNGTQRFFSSTKDALSPGGSKKSSRTSWTGNSPPKKKKPSSSSWFPWSRTPAEREGPKTLDEWFKLKRPDAL